MVVEEGVFEDVAEAVAAGDVVADLEVGGGVEGPFLFAVEGGDVDAAGDVDACNIILLALWCPYFDACQRLLLMNSIKACVLPFNAVPYYCCIRMYEKTHYYSHR